MNVRAGFEQHGHGFEAFHPGRQVKWGASPVVAGVHIRARSQQCRQDDRVLDESEAVFPGFAPGGVVQGRASHVIASVHIRAGFQQQCHDCRVAAGGRLVGATPPRLGGEQKRSVPVPVAGVRIRPGRQAGGSGLGGGDASEPPRVPVATVERIGDLAPVIDQGGVRAEFQEQVGHRGVAPGGVQGGVPGAVPCVQIRTGPRQFGNDRARARFGRPMQRCPAPPVPRLDIRTGLDQHSENRGVPGVAGCEVQRSVPFTRIPALTVSRVEVRPGFEARRDGLGGGSIEEGARIPVVAVFLRGCGNGERGECQSRCQPCDHLHSLQPIPEEPVRRPRRV